ncbi:hypothetical protein GCM10022233_67760 [Streptomyces shaanxiensis]|uniref:Uncharacterized protein n=1 Tax=Streptomyces shaanxiensis TaxID=653357 RepID=A0ABP7W219_9ACTN
MVRHIGVPVVTFAVQPLGDLLELVRLQPDERHLRTPRGELAGEQLTDTPRRTGDDGDLPFEAHPAHAPSFTCV